jgi:hypothetical protein
MPGTGTHPVPRRRVRPHGATLQVKLSVRVKNKHVNRTMQQFVPVDDRSLLLANDVIVFINDIENIFHGHGNIEVVRLARRWNWQTASRKS